MKQIKSLHFAEARGRHTVVAAVVIIDVIVHSFINVPYHSVNKCIYKFNGGKSVY